MNKLYYESCLWADKSMLLTVYYEPAVQRHEQQKLGALYEHERLDWS